MPSQRLSLETPKCNLNLSVHQVPARTPQDPVAEVVGPEIEGAPRDPARGREEGKVAEDTPAPLAAVHGDAQGLGTVKLRNTEYDFTLSIYLSTDHLDLVFC